jgi:hypothetical protein
MAEKVSARTAVIRYLSVRPAASKAELVEGTPFTERTIYRVVKELVKEKIVFEGVTINPAHASGRNYYIFIQTIPEKLPLSKKLVIGEVDSQKGLIDQIRLAVENNARLRDLRIESIDVIHGADFDIVLCIRTENEDQVRLLVNGGLLKHRQVANTKTLAGWRTRNPAMEDLASERG